jgi:hypothetical protein
MKTTLEQPDLLVLEDVPWILGAVFVAVILIPVGIGTAMVLNGEATGLLVALGGAAFGAIFFAAFVRRTRLVLDRAAGLAELKRRSVFGLKAWTWRLDEIDRAWVESSTSDGSTTYRPVLILASGEHQPITPVYSSGQGAHRATTAITRWLGR